MSYDIDKKELAVRNPEGETITGKGKSKYRGSEGGIT
jgi:hypothetical protein